MPWKSSEERRQMLEWNQRLDVFNRFLNGLDPRPDAQDRINEFVSSMTAQQREQLKRDIDAMTMYNCFAGTWELRPLIDRALTPYGLGTFSKLILPAACPDCGYEWNNHNSNCPQFGYDPRTHKPAYVKSKGGRPKSVDESKIR